MSVEDDLMNFVQKAIEHSIQEFDGELRENTSLIQSGLIDSLTVLQLAEWIEQHIGFEIDMTTFDPLEEWDTMKAILTFIETKKGARSE